jgi:hypothetical protein
MGFFFMKFMPYYAHTIKTMLEGNGIFFMKFMPYYAPRKNLGEHQGQNTIFGGGASLFLRGIYA